MPRRLQPPSTPMIHPYLPSHLRSNPNPIDASSHFSIRHRNKPRSPLDFTKRNLPSFLYSECSNSNVPSTRHFGSYRSEPRLTTARSMQNIDLPYLMHPRPRPSFSISTPQIHLPPSHLDHLRPPNQPSKPEPTPAPLPLEPLHRFQKPTKTSPPPN